MFQGFGHCSSVFWIYPPQPLDYVLPLYLIGVHAYFSKGKQRHTLKTDHIRDIHVSLMTVAPIVGVL